MNRHQRRLRTGAILFSLGVALSGPAASQERHNEWAVQWAQGLPASNGPGAASLSYSRELAPHWWIGASTGWGRWIRTGDYAGPHAALHTRYRFGTHSDDWHPYVGAELGGSMQGAFTALGMASGFAGVAYDLNASLTVTTDLCLSQVRLSRAAPAAIEQHVSERTHSLRVGVALRF